MTTQTRSSAKSAPKAATKPVAAKAAPKPAAAKAEAKPAEKTVEQQVETVADAATAAADDAKERVVVSIDQAEKVAEEAVKSAVETGDQITAATREQVEKANAALVKGYDEFAAIQKQGLDAWIKAGTVLAKGAEDLSKTCLALAQETAASNSEAAQAMLRAKSLEEIVELQSEFARKSFDRSVADGTKISELSLKIANEAFGPLQEQFNAAVEKAMKPLAA